LPAILVLLVLLAIPAILTVFQSLFVVPADGVGIGTFTRVDNYLYIFKNEIFWATCLRSILFAAIFIIGSTVIGLAGALLLNEKFIGRIFLRGLLVLPWACPWLIVGIIWKWFLDGNIGLFNGVLIRLHLISEYKDFLSDPNWALLMTALAATWRQSCLVALLLLAGLQTLPRDISDAASVDGAGIFQRFRHITLPWLRPALTVVTVLNVIYGLMQFDVIFAMTQGGPGSSTTLLSYLIYRQFFIFTNFGVGSALAVALAIIALIGGLIAVKTLYRKIEV
jgi:multiple sugar transport system permease protein